MGQKTIWILGIVAFVWGMLTLYVEKAGPKQAVSFGNPNARKHVLIVYDPDPLYNLDEQVCQNLAQGLAKANCYVEVQSVAVAREEMNKTFDLYVFCANTYNWSPDWVLVGYINRHPHLENQPVVAITLGGGSTARSQRLLEKKILRKKAKLLAIKSLWLWRPNDENRMTESNVKVAVSIAHDWGIALATEL
ncbi:MAG: hypothetical protein DA408_03475 [Bacteroidetes bacterium]|nr:MAG: hypothetical protein C7N36_00375 [Bacteroidota bacterium]PTM14347.1 MAG: hypothetical protein DA408_03475 [Bacteroidota bacterium]